MMTLLQTDDPNTDMVILLQNILLQIWYGDTSTDMVLVDIIKK